MNNKHNKKSPKDEQPATVLASRDHSVRKRVSTEASSQAEASKQSDVSESSETSNSHDIPEMPVFDANADSLQNLRALSQINDVFQAQQSEHGFRRAQNDVNEKLAEAKITLNKRFELIAVLGAGGMGTVYKAKDMRKVEAQDSNPFIAVKVLNSDFRKHPDAFVSLQREASRSHTLSHPNIVTVHDFDRDGNTIYMTMELLQGDALDSYLNKHRKTGVGTEKAFAIVKELATALAFAHRKGIIHSDLKPANIFLSNDGVKILDFGIARLAAESQHKDQFDAGEIGAITPAYASLEMIERKEPHPSDDLYALALITYELLTGKHPYQSKSAAAAKGLGLEPAKIEGLSKKQWSALSSALALERSDRTQNVKDFHNALTEKFQFPVFKVVSLVLLILVGWFSYVNFLVPDELTLKIDETLAKAENCFQSKEYACAASEAEALLKLSADHRRAKQIFAESTKAIEEQQLLTRINEHLNQARNCFRQQDYVCAVEAADKVLGLSANQIEAQQIINNAGQMIERQRSELAEKEQNFNVHINKANECLAQKKYDCAIESAELAQTFKPESAQAVTIIQNANYAVNQLRENRQKANKILKDGQECYKKLNYSCAIAKSESALEFVPGHRGALRLKRNAEAAIAKLKKTIEIE